MNARMTKAEAIAAGDVAALTHALRDELLEGKDNIPLALKMLKGWVVWRTTEIDPATGKFNKIPVYPRSGKNRHGEQGAPEDMANLGTWAEAGAAFQRDPSIAGAGFALLPEFGIVALDADHCVEGGNVRSDVAHLTAGTYCEISPSGTGLRAFWRGAANNGKNHDSGFELFHTQGFVTVTGHQVENLHSLIQGPADHLPALDEGTRAELERLSTPAGRGSGNGKKQSGRLHEAADADLVFAALKEAGLVERHMGHGKYSITCPFEEEHSDPNRPPGDGDTVYFLPHTEGYVQGHFHCAHAHCADRVDEDFLEALGLKGTGEEFFNDNSGEWGEPRPLPDHLPPVPAFDPALLPQALRPWIEDIAERMQIGLDIPAIGAVTALSAAIGRRARIMPKALDDWTVVPNLWGMVVAPPGYLKSPALAEVMKPLQRLQSEAFKEYEAAMAAWEQEKAIVKLRNQAHRQRALTQLKKGDDGLPEMLPEPEAPVATRYIVNNFSLEALGEVLIGNPNGVLAFSDELSGLLVMSQKPGNEGLLDFMLNAWNGDGAFTFDRIGRGVRRLEAVCIAALGGIQPGRLVEHIDGATHGGSNDSGLVQRFQLMTWPDLPTKWVLVDRMPDSEAQDAAYRVFEKAVGRDPVRAFDDETEADSVPDVRRFDPQAQAAFYGWLEQLEGELRGDTLPPVMASHLSKYRSLVPSLALIFAVADDVQGPIPLRYVEQAIGWTKYLRPHAERAYACTTRSDARHARALLAKIAEGVVADGFKLADVYQKGWSLLDSSGVTKATQLLCDYGYLRRVKTTQSGGAGGRPSISYRINPKAKGTNI